MVYKFFVSLPMRDKTPEQIRAMQDAMFKIAVTSLIAREEIPADAETVMIDSYKPEFKGMHNVAALGESIKMMAEADFVVSLCGAYGSPGCPVERSVAYNYNIPVIQIQDALVTKGNKKE